MKRMKRKMKNQARYKGAEYNLYSKYLQNQTFVPQFVAGYQFNAQDYQNNWRPIGIEAPLAAFMVDYIQNPTLFNSYAYMTVNWFKVKYRMWHTTTTGQIQLVSSHWYRDRDCYWSPVTADQNTAFTLAGLNATTVGAMRQAVVYLKKGKSCGFKHKVKAGKRYRIPLQGPAGLVEFLTRFPNYNLTTFLLWIEGNANWSAVDVNFNPQNNPFGPVADGINGILAQNSPVGMNCICFPDTIGILAPVAPVAVLGTYTVEAKFSMQGKLWRTTDRTFNRFNKTFTKTIDFVK